MKGETTMNIYEKLGIAGLITSIGAIGYSIYTHIKAKRIDALLEKTTNKIANNISVDIPDEIMADAIERAAEREVGRAIAKASTVTIQTAKRSIENDVNTMVNDLRPDITESLTREVTKQVADLDVQRLKKEVREQAKDIVVSKFDGQLDSLLEDFNKNLTNLSKIYSSIADNITKKNDATVLKIER